MKDKETKSKTKKQNSSTSPKFEVVVPFPEDRVVRDRNIENLIRRLRRAKEDLSEVIVLGLDVNDELFITTTGTSRKDALWILELAKLDIYGLLGEE